MSDIKTQHKLIDIQAADYLTQILPDLDIHALVEDTKTASQKYAVDIPEVSLDPKPKTEPTKPQINPVSDIKPVPSNQGPVGGGSSPDPRPQTPTTQPSMSPKPQGQPAPAAPPLPSTPQQPMPQSQPDLMMHPKIKEIDGKIAELYKIMDSTVTMPVLHAFRESMIKEIIDITKDLNAKFEDFKKHTVPERLHFDTEILYKDKVFGKICDILDEILIPLFDLVPHYNLISISNTKYYEDSTIKNSLITINIEVDKDDFKYNFTVDVPVLNGVINAPVFIRKANKLIPLVKSEIQKELTNGYMKATPSIVEDSYRGNIFSPISQQVPYVDDPNQKEYYSTSSQPSTAVPETRWKGVGSGKNKSMDGVGSFSVNSPIYGPKY